MQREKDNDHDHGDHGEDDDDDDSNDKCELDIGGLLVTHSTNQFQVLHILTGHSYICLLLTMVMIFNIVRSVQSKYVCKKMRRLSCLFMMVSYRRGRKRCKSEWKWEGFAWRRENMKISYYDMVMVVVLFEWNLIHVVW